MPELNDDVARWFEAQRGIKRATVEAFGIYTTKKEIVTPYPEGMTKYRWSSDPQNPFGLAKEGRGFSWKDADGNSGQAGQVPFLPPDFEPRERMIVLEGETDTMAAWQALPDSLRGKVSIIGLSGVGSWNAAVMGKDKNGAQVRPYRLDELFGAAKRVFVVLDNDDPYENPEGNKSVENGWQQIRLDLGKRARRVRLPQGPADVAEFFMSYDWAAFEVLLKQAAQPKFHYAALDLTKPPPPTDWLIHELIEMGVVTVIAADSGAGKSFFTQGMTVDLLAGVERFLGLEIRKENARILYLDEENSDVLVAQRLAALGFKPEMQERLRYISRQGVNLHDNPEWFLEDALEFEPDLVILDSQSAISVGVKENANDEMTEFYRRSVLPIPRLTGAATIVLHHTPSDGSRPRGATAIRAAADQVLTMIPAEANGITAESRFNIFPSKPRREGAYLTAEIVGSMETDGWVRVRSVGEDVM